MSEITENLKLELWNETDTEKNMSESPEFDYLKTVYNNFKKTDNAVGKDRQAINSELNLLSGVEDVEMLTATGTWANRTWRSASGGTGTRERIDIENPPNSRFQKGWKLTGSTIGNSDICQDAVPISNSQNYKISCYARKISGEPILRMQYGKNPYIVQTYKLENTNWQQYSFVFKIGEKNDNSTNGSTNIYFGIGNCIGTLEICGLRLEKVDNELKEEIEKLKVENAELKQFKENAEETMLDTQTEIAETIVVNNSTNGIGKINIYGRQKQEKRNGYNLITYPFAENAKTQNGITFTDNKNGTITVNGTSTGYAGLVLAELLLKAGTYTLKANNNLSSAIANYRIRIGNLDDNNNIIKTLGIGKATFTLNTDTNVQIVLQAVVDGITANNNLWKPLLYFGTDEKEFEQYGISPSIEFPSEIKVVENNIKIISSNKNMYQMPESITTNGVTFTKNDDDSVNIVGTATQQANFYKYIEDTCLKDGETYTFSCNQALPNGVTILCENMQNNTWLSHVFGDNTMLKTNNTVITNKIRLNGNRVRYCIRVAEGANVKMQGLKIQIERGNKNTDIIKHQGEILIMPIQKQMLEGDKFVKINGKWKEEHHWEKYIFDGTELFIMQNENKRVYFEQSRNSSKLKKKPICVNGDLNRGQIPYCDILSGYSPDKTWAGTQGISYDSGISDTLSGIDICLNGLTTVAEYQQALNGHYVWYKTREIEYIDCTDEQCKILDKINTYKNTTIITTDNELAKIDLKYKVDTLKAIQDLMQTSMVEESEE